MLMKLRELINSTNSLQALKAQRVKRASVSFKLAGIIKTLQSHLEQYAVAQRELCERLGKLNPDKNRYEFDGNFPEYQRELNELLDTEIDVQVNQLTIAELESAGLEVSADDLLTLGWLIAE